jgi:hypothetical protein
MHRRAKRIVMKSFASLALLLSLFVLSGCDSYEKKAKAWVPVAEKQLAVFEFPGGNWNVERLNRDISAADEMASRIRELEYAREDRESEKRAISELLQEKNNRFKAFELADPRMKPLPERKTGLDDIASLKQNYAQQALLYESSRASDEFGARPENQMADRQMAKSNARLEEIEARIRGFGLIPADTTSEQQQAKGNEARRDLNTKWPVDATLVAAKACRSVAMELGSPPDRLKDVNAKIMEFCDLLEQSAAYRKRSFGHERIVATQRTTDLVESKAAQILEVIKLRLDLK